MILSFVKLMLMATVSALKAKQCAEAQRGTLTPFFSLLADVAVWGGPVVLTGWMAVVFFLGEKIATTAVLTAGRKALWVCYLSQVTACMAVGLATGAYNVYYSGYVLGQQGLECFLIPIMTVLLC